jgi:hypothetical protein
MCWLEYPRVQLHYAAQRDRRTTVGTGDGWTTLAHGDARSVTLLELGLIDRLLEIRHLAVGGLSVDLLLLQLFDQRSLQTE